ncbi:uncharacterized protein J3R85_000376 [Psidium guajava]|nr:uncharacterized protein J3R85_000376 [Psidium guajava]
MNTWAVFPSSTISLFCSLKVWSNQAQWGQQLLIRKQQENLFANSLSWRKCYHSSIKPSGFLFFGSSKLVGVSRWLIPSSIESFISSSSFDHLC